MVRSLLSRERDHFATSEVAARQAGTDARWTETERDSETARDRQAQTQTDR